MKQMAARRSWAITRNAMSDGICLVLPPLGAVASVRSPPSALIIHLFEEFVPPTPRGGVPHACIPLADAADFGGVAETTPPAYYFAG